MKKTGFLNIRYSDYGTLSINSGVLKPLKNDLKSKESGAADLAIISTNNARGP